MGLLLLIYLQGFQIKLFRQHREPVCNQAQTEDVALSYKCIVSGYLQFSWLSIIEE